MAYTNRGGPPFARQLSVNTSGAISLNGVANTTQANGAPFMLPAPTSHIQLTASLFPVKVYFNQNDFDQDMAFVQIPADTKIDGAWQVRQLWLKGVGGSANVDLIGVGKV